MGIPSIYSMLSSPTGMFLFLKIMYFVLDTFKDNLFALNQTDALDSSLLASLHKFLISDDA